MSAFDDGFAVGYVLGKKKGGGGGPCPPCECSGVQQAVAGFTDDRTPTKSETVKTASSEYSYTIEDI